MAIQFRKASRHPPILAPRLQVSTDRSATGRFHGDLAFMRLRPHHRRQFSEPDQTQVQHAQVTTTDVHGWDFYRMINSDQAGFSLGFRCPAVP